MDALAPLPLPVGELPADLQRFGNPNAPTPAKMMAAKGMVPVKGAGLVTLLVQLSFDPDDTVKSAAVDALSNMPDDVLLPACDTEMHPSIADHIATVHKGREAVLEHLVLNNGTSPLTVARIAASSSERLCEVVATNQQRLLAAPKIIEALYKNKNTRMSTVDRLVELAARNNVELTGIPMFKAHAKAIQGQLIPEPSEEPLPGDNIFSEALAHDSEESAFDTKEEAVNEDEVKDQFKPLSFRIAQMSAPEKLRMAMVGGSAARSILIRDNNRQIAMAAVSSPAFTEMEAVEIAKSKEVSEEILRYVGNKRQWLKSYELKRTLTFNPKTPLAIALRFVAHLRPNDLRDLAKMKGVRGPLKSSALQRYQKKTKG